MNSGETMPSIAARGRGTSTADDAPSTRTTVRHSRGKDSADLATATIAESSTWGDPLPTSGQDGLRDARTMARNTMADDCPDSTTVCGSSAIQSLSAPEGATIS